MHSSTILRRTPAGEAELAAPANGLSLTQRRFLTLLDTSCEVDQMRLRHRAIAEKFDRDLGRLTQLGLVAGEAPPALRGSNAASIAATRARLREGPPAPHGIDAVAGSVRLGAPRLARRVPFALLPIVAGALAWIAWQHLAPPAAPKRGDGGVASTSPATGNRAPLAIPPEPAPIATRTLRSDPVGRSRDVKDAHAAPRNTEPKPAGEPASAKTHPFPASDRAGNDREAAAIATDKDQAAFAEGRLVPDEASRKTPDTAKVAPITGPTSSTAAVPIPLAPTPLTPTPPAPAPAAAATPLTAIPSAPVATAPSKALIEARSAGSMPIQIASAAPMAGLLRSAPPPSLVPISRDAPDFPREAIALGFATGNVKARLTVDAKGNVSNVEIVEASHRAFDRAVREALARWRFEPGMGGRTTMVDVAFKRD